MDFENQAPGAHFLFFFLSCFPAQRSADYEQLKAAFQETIWKRTCALMPQLEEAADYVDLASPVTNRFYLNAPEGELYGADHDVGRWVISSFPFFFEYF